MNYTFENSGPRNAAAAWLPGPLALTFFVSSLYTYLCPLSMCGKYDNSRSIFTNLTKSDNVKLICLPITPYTRADACV